mmetsp:Transcript_29557/g.56794  ORF Transcript_29557/g.56794 Transcript_29557/m.56794 type:complete len:319 (+) Transcript_29557:514-1470(+)
MQTAGGPGKEVGKAAGTGLKGGWASILKPPSDKDIKGKRRTHKAFDLPRRVFDYLVVLDFEWTADNKKGFGPPEIIEFPSVIVQGQYPFAFVDTIQMYVKPVQNPILTKFIKELTAITQEQVDTGLTLKDAMGKYDAWLEDNGLRTRPGNEPRPRSSPDSSLPCASTQAHSSPGKTFAIVTWGDSDVMGVLHNQLKGLGIPRPVYFDSWINLKTLFKQHYRREARGGLENVVNSCGLSFDGRAHSGLVDSINTAKICVQMMQQGFKFWRTTRGFGANGEAFGTQQAKRHRDGMGSSLGSLCTEVQDQMPTIKEARSTS